MLNINKNTKEIDGLETWLSIVLIFIVLIVFLIFLVWIDWKFKCRKTARENKLKVYATGYAIFKACDDKLNLITIMDGILGTNSNELVFGNRFQDDAMYLTKELTDICSFNVLEYNEKEFLKFVHKNCDVKDVKTKYFIRNMAGLSTSTHMPKFLKKRMMCKIQFTNDEDLYFYFKNLSKNTQAIENLNKLIP